MRASPNLRPGLSHFEFPAVVFITGAAVLVIEISAARILSAYFGNTIYSFSSVITIILAALSAGYYVGGKRADKDPSYKSFYQTILSGGLSVLGLQVLTVYLLPLLGRLPIVWGPLVSAAVMFFLPAFLLGALSPYAVKLQTLASTEEGVGTVSGSIFFWSTMGSLFGSLVTGFVLIPMIGLQSILFSVALALMAVGLSGLAAHRSLATRSLLEAVTLLLLTGLLVGVRTHDVGKDYVFLKDGVYERLAIQDKIINGFTTRRFLQDRSSSGALRIGSDALVSRYAKYYQLYKAFNIKLKTALFMGGGIYMMPGRLLKEEPEATVHVAEIEPSLKSLAERYFNLKPSDRLVNHVIDGRRLLRDSDRKYDLIFSDVYNSLYSVPPHFTTLEFFTLAKTRLQPGGVFMANIIGKLKDKEPSFVLSELNTFRQVFPSSYVFAVDGPSLHGRQNLILVGLNREDSVPFETIAKGAVADAFKAHLTDLSRFDIDRHPILTDDYAPVEYLNASVMESSIKLQTIASRVEDLRERIEDFFNSDNRPRSNASKSYFDGTRAYTLVERQVELGSRSLTSSGHAAVQDFIQSELGNIGIPVYRQLWNHTTGDGRVLPLMNIVARINENASRRVIVGTHYDTRRYANGDHLQPTSYVPGANDGSSGTAVLIELARSLKVHTSFLPFGIDLVFFDGEEGEEDNPEWSPLGSEYFAANLDHFYKRGKPFLGIVVDMVGDSDLQIYKEENSVAGAPEATERFWQLARTGYPDIFKNRVKHRLRDDHTALNKTGIPSFLLIDFDYPHFHTTQDTPDKVSLDSLDAVGESLLLFLNTEGTIRQKPETSSGRWPLT